MSRYQVTFDRIGRNRAVVPLQVDAAGADDLAEAIYRYARPWLMSRDVEVVLDQAGPLTGTIFCGFQVGGTFTITASTEDGCE